MKVSGIVLAHGGHLEIEKLVRVSFRQIFGRFFMYQDVYINVLHVRSWMTVLYATYVVLFYINIYYTYYIYIYKMYIIYIIHIQYTIYVIYIFFSIKSTNDNNISVKLCNEELDTFNKLRHDL